MKICVFSDIHGNYEQFLKLTETDDFKSADIRICLGDVVGLGPYQKECMDLLMKYKHIFLLGNHEARMTKLIDDLNPSIDPDICKQFDMNRERLREYLPLFENLPRDYTLHIAGKTLYFTHYGWHNNDMANKDTVLKNKSLTEQFGLQNKDYDYVIYGHVHSPSEKNENDTNFINVGSLGLKSPSNYFMIEEKNNQLFFERKTLDFDKDKFLKECQRINFPKWEQLLNFSFDNNLERNIGTILVTGGGGYIGSNIVLKLVQQGYKVVVVDNFSNSNSTVIRNLQEKYKNNIKIYNFDLLDTEKLEKVLVNENIFSVLHLAGKKYVPESFNKEEEYYLNNVVLTQKLLDSMEKCKIKNLVFSSSITVYGKPSCETVKETEPLSPLSPYASQKAECEKLVQEWQSRTKSSAVILRLSNPIGANIDYLLGDNPKTTQYKGILPYLLDKAKNNNPIVLNGGDHPTKDGTTIRDYIHVEDVASAFIKASAMQNGEFNVFNIGSGGEGYSVLDILNQVEKSLNKKLDYSFGPKREGDVSVFISDNNNAKKRLNLNITKKLSDMVDSQVTFEENLNKNNNETEPIL